MKACNSGRHGRFPAKEYRWGRWFVLFGCLTAMGMAMATAIADELSQRMREAGHPLTAVERLWALSDDADWRVREALGRNRKSPPALLEKLAGDADMAVRIAVATNLATPEAIHFQLARDAAPDVRSVVARFEYTPILVLLLLADDPSVDIRLEVARSLNADESVLRKLMQDADPQIRQLAEQALQRLLGEPS